MTSSAIKALNPVPCLHQATPATKAPGTKPSAASPLDDANTVMLNDEAQAKGLLVSRSAAETKVKEDNRL